MKKWTWLTVPVAVMGLALVFWGGTVLAQEPAKAQVAFSGNSTGMAGYCRDLMDDYQAAPGANWTEMRNYCQNASGMMGAGGMMVGGNMTGPGGMMNGGGMMGGGMMGR